MPSPVCRAFVVCVITLGAAAARGERAAAHGSVDQALQSVAGCNVLNFTATVTQAGGQRQGFVPAQPGLVAVDACVMAEAGPTEVDVLIRTGTAGAPGDVIGGGSFVANGSAYEHVDFAAPIAVTPGQTYVIELATAAGLEVTWLGNPPDIDLYAAGEANAPGIVSDFAFRTYAGVLPATPTPPPTKTAAPTKTRTPSATRTPVPTQTSQPTATPPSIASTPGATPEVAAAAPTPPPSGSAARNASPTRVSGVLGGARRVGVIRPPGVGSGSRTVAYPWGTVAGALLAAGAASVCTGLAARRSRRR